MQRRRKLFLAFGRSLLPFLGRRRGASASTLGLLGFQLARSITTWTLTLRRWARISEDVMLPLRTFHAEMRILPPRGTESMVRLTCADQAADVAGLPVGVVERRALLGT